MSSPDPPVALDGSCSVIYDNTLFVYSPDAFQSLPLTQGAKWSSLANGTSVTGATCVQAGNDALWIVGGTASDPNYAGLQKYTFASSSWETILPVVNVTKNRLGHSATYLASSSMILVYAGSKVDPKQLSQETFSIQTQKPYNVLAYSGTTPPVIQPILLAWNDSSAITLGGNSDNQDIYMFSASHNRWRKYETSLPMVPKATASQQATLVQGSDGSKVLELYDMSVSPNVVSRYVLQNAQGLPAQTGKTIGSSGNKKRKRDLTLSDWPAYNNSAAPTYTRSGFDLAQGQNGMVAISGGNDDHPVALFNEQENTWIDSSTFFGINDNNGQAFLGPSTTSSSSPTHSATSTSVPSSDSDHPKTSLILGAVLGSILGFIALLIIFLLLIRQRRRSKAANESAENGEKPRLSFADRGAPFMMEGGNVANGTNGFDPHSSIAIVGGPGMGHTRGMDSRGSESSTTRLVPGKKSGLGMHDAMEMATIREKHDSGSPHAPSPGNGGLMPPKRSSGWSRYFSGNTDVLPGSRGSRTSSRKSKSALSRKSTRSSVGSSHYAASQHDCGTHGPVELPPLRFGEEFEETRVNSLVTTQADSTPGKSSTSRDRPDTMGSELSSNPPSTLDDTIFTYEPSPGDDNHRWTPVESANNRSQWSRDWTVTSGAGNRDTTTSSIYGPSAAVRTTTTGGALGARQSGLRNSAVPGPPPSATYTTPSGASAFHTGPVGGAVYPSNRPSTTRTDTHDAFLDTRAQGPVYGATNQARGYDAPVNVGTDLNALAKAPGATALFAAPAAPVSAQPEQGALASRPTPAQSSVPAPFALKEVTNSFPDKQMAPAAAAPRGLDSAGDPPVQEISKPAAIATADARHDNTANGWPTPPQRASIVDMDDESDYYDEEPEVVYATASSGLAPTAMTAIPVPGSTAMEYTVKKPVQKSGNTDMGWVNLSG